MFNILVISSLVFNTLSDKYTPIQNKKLCNFNTLILLNNLK